MSSIKGNIILNSINTITGVFFPVITFPYAARILLPEGIGAVDFLNSIISYIILFTSLGIPMYAVKEIANNRDSLLLKSKIAVEIILLSITLCIGGYIIVLLLAHIVPQIQHQSILFYILSLSILFNSIGVEWFYKGIEDFKFITVRAITFRIISAILLFTLVKDSSDLLIYGGIFVLSTVGNNFVNFVHLRKHIYINTQVLKELKITRHIKPALKVFVLNLIISLYVYLNSLMLGLIQGDEAVGIFTAGTKISHVGLTLISSIGTVLLPRCSNLLQKGDIIGFSTVIAKSVKLTIGLSLPLVVGLIILSEPITILFCGEDYQASIPVLCLNAPVIILIGLTNVMGIQILYPMNKINIVILSVAGGALINIILNLCLIHSLSSVGTAVATLVAEFSVFIIQILLGNKFFPFRWKEVIVSNYIIATIIMGIAIYFVHIFIINLWLQLITAVTCGIIIYSCFLYIRKDSLYNELLRFIQRKKI